MMENQSNKNNDQLFFYSPVQKDTWELVKAKKRNKLTNQMEETDEKPPRVRVIKGLPRVTVAGLIKDDTIYFGFTICSKNDTFIKKHGRNKALGRIKAGKIAMEIPVLNRAEIGKTFVVTAKSLCDQVLKELTGTKRELQPA